MTRLPRIVKNRCEVLGLTRARLEKMIGEAIVDAYTEDEEKIGIQTMVQDGIEVPFETVVLGVQVRVEKIDILGDNEIVAICRHGRKRQAIPILDLPLPTPLPKGVEWIEAYRLWSGGG